MIILKSVMSDKIIPVNSKVSDYEILARNIYATSQYSSSKGLKKNRFYPNYKKESREYKGKQVCRVSVQRLCFAKWDGVVEWANKTKNDSQELIGFEIAPAHVAIDFGFGLEAAAHIKNPFHAHIYIKQLDLPFPQSEEVLSEVMNSGLRRSIDEMTSKFKFVKTDELKQSLLDFPETCEDCLSES